MTKRVPQSKRLQLINKWLRGIEDENFEVFPTKTEGKYIVRPRKEPLVKPPPEPQKELPQAELESCYSKPLTDEHAVKADEPAEEKLDQEEQKYYPEKIPKQKEEPIKKQESSTQFDRSSSQMRRGSSADTTNNINFEILSELRALGQEMRLKREKKEQKKMIKEVMNKELYKRNHYTQPQYIQQPQAELESCYRKPNVPEPEAEEEDFAEPPRQIISRRRNNIFSDIY